MGKPYCVWFLECDHCHENVEGGTRPEVYQVARDAGWSVSGRTKLCDQCKSFKE